mgnify:FL=1
MIELVLTICISLSLICTKGDFIYYEQSGFKTFEDCNRGAIALLNRLLNAEQITVEQAMSAGVLCRTKL